MKKSRITLIIVCFLICIWLVNKIVNNWYFNHYAYLNQNPYSEHLDFKIKRVSYHNIESHSIGEAPIIYSNDVVPSDTLPPKENYWGWISFDTIKQQYYFKETYYKRLPEQSNEDDITVEEIRHWMVLDKEGRLIDSIAADSLLPPSTVILLEDEKGLSPNWSDKKSVVYINYFSREEFNWNLFNPFSGLGNPTGRKPRAYWYGHAYYTINHANQKIKFKEVAGSFGHGDYGHDLRFFITPKRFKNIPLLTFIITDENFERAGLYVIVKNK